MGFVLELVRADQAVDAQRAVEHGPLVVAARGVDEAVPLRIGLLEQRGVVGEVPRGSPAEADGIVHRQAPAEVKVELVLARAPRRLVTVGREGVAGLAVEQPACRDDLLVRVLLLDDHIGDDGLPLHVDARRAAANDVDPLDLSNRDTRQRAVQRVGLDRRALAIDQYVAGSARKAANLVAAVEAEARDAVDHVQRRVRARLGEIGRRVGDHTLLRGDGLGSGHSLLCGRRQRQHHRQN